MPAQNTKMIKIKFIYNKFMMTFIIIKNQMKKISERKIREYLKCKNQKILKTIYIFKMYFNKNKRIY